jgi:hydroxymethylpyrimidine pyrophosphatase-like HAD family hydrolase
LFTDVVPVGGNKSIGMEKILAYFGISREETMAFGDGGNDIPMLEYAGIGVAMGNASEEVQRHADFVTSGVDDEGIVHALKHFHIGGL